MKTAEKDWKVVLDLFETINFIHALFWGHLVLEKLLKAHWVKDNEDNAPPRTHNLVRLLEQTNLLFDEDDILFMGKMNELQLEGRYPEYTTNIYNLYKNKETSIIIERINKLRICLLNKLQ